MPAPLYDLLPATGAEAGADELLGRFLDYVAAKGLTLYPAQEEAILELFEGKNVILNTPTGLGQVAGRLGAALRRARPRPALDLHLPDQGARQREVDGAVPRARARERRASSTGDATVNRDAPVLCCTAEILANIALREGEQAPASTTW